MAGRKHDHHRNTTTAQSHKVGPTERPADSRGRTAATYFERIRETQVFPFFHRLDRLRRGKGYRVLDWTRARRELL
jgi:hypothetical protein